MIDIHKMLQDGERLVYAVPGKCHEVFLYIPDCRKELVFNEYSPSKIDCLDQKLYDLHAMKCCYYRECKVVYDLLDKSVYIVSPFYPDGGTIIDLFPVAEDFNHNIDSELQSDKVLLPE